MDPRGDHQGHDHEIREKCPGFVHLSSICNRSGKVEAVLLDLRLEHDLRDAEQVLNLLPQCDRQAQLHDETYVFVGLGYTLLPASFEVMHQLRGEEGSSVPALSLTSSRIGVPRHRETATRTAPLYSWHG